MKLFYCKYCGIVYNFNLEAGIEFKPKYTDCPICKTIFAFVPVKEK